MAKKPPKKPVGTFLAAAVFCEQTVGGDDNTISCIRIIDTVTVQVPSDAPADIPSEKTRVPIMVRGLISFRRAGSGKKFHHIQAIMTSPKGKKATMLDERIQFKKGAISTHNVRFEAGIAIAVTGVYWLAVILDGKEYSQMPLLVNVTRNPAEKSGSGKAPAVKN
jgi:hypothetical protein